MRSLVALPLALLFVAACGPNGGDRDVSDDDSGDNTSDQDQDQDNTDDLPIPDAPPDAPDAAPLPDGALPDGALPDGALPDSALPDAAMPDAPMPDAPMPDAPMPDAPMPDAPMPDAPMPDAAMPDAPMPDAATPDAATPDAAPDAAPPDAPAPACTLATSLGSVTPPNQFAEQTTQTTTVPSYTYGGLLNVDANPDAIQFELWNGFGVFAGGIVPGTYAISGVELDYATCGACIFALGDIDMSGTAQQAYFATGGTLTLTQIGPRMIGTLSNMTFGSIDATTGNPDGLCTSSLASFTFDVSITNNTARATGRPRIQFTPVGPKSPIAKSQVCLPTSAL